MKIVSTYKVKIKESNHQAFADTVNMYRHAINFYIDVCLKEWDKISLLKGTFRNDLVEHLTLISSKNPSAKYPIPFRQYPCYLRRAAISEAIGKVSSYKSHIANWNANPQGKEPGRPVAGYIYPTLYRYNCFVRTGLYTARLKVFMNKKWDWLNVELKKTDVDYILRHCQNRRECVPTLRRRGKNWYLDFAFKENVRLTEKHVEDQIIIGVDLGLNNACTCSAMLANGTIIGRKFLKLSKEQANLWHCLNKIKKARQNRANRRPKMWSRVKNINKDIASKTAQFIEDFAVQYDADVIVFEYLDLKGKKHCPNTQRLHHWKGRAVQRIVTDKAHRHGIRITHVNAWGTSSFAFDGSGKVKRDKKNYSMCTFTNGKRYNCDLSASYNIGARYFIREILKSLPVKARLDIEAKVPQCSKRTTCTLSTLIRLNAELEA